MRVKDCQVVFTNNCANARSTLTARQGPRRATFNSSGVEYTIVAVKEEQLQQRMQANLADGWSERISQTGRASIYGIEFDTGRALTRPDSENALNELLALLQKQPNWAMLVAGHTDNFGTDTINVPLSRYRLRRNATRSAFCCAVIPALNRPL